MLRGSAAAMMGAYGLAPRYGLAADIPYEYDGSKFQMAAPEPNPKRGGVLRYGILNRPPHFDVHQSGTVGNIGTQGCMFDNLIRRDPRDSGKTIVPDLAHSWEIAKDGKTYTFHLRQGVQFHDGTDFTSADVKATFDRICKPPPGVSIPRTALFTAVKRDQRAGQVHHRIQAGRAALGQFHDVRLRQRLERHLQQEDAGREQLRSAQGPQHPRHRPLQDAAAGRERDLGDGAEPELLEQGPALPRWHRVLPSAAVLAGAGGRHSVGPGGLCPRARPGHRPQGGGDAGPVHREILPERDPRNMDQ